MQSSSLPITSQKNAARPNGKNYLAFINVGLSFLLFLAWVQDGIPPFVEPRSVDAHHAAYAPDREVRRKGVDYFKLAPSKLKNAFSAPPPFTVYPFIY